MVGGRRSTGLSDDAIFARLEPGGTLDGAFGDAGITVVSSAAIRALLLDPVGRILGAGKKRRPALGVTDSLLVRLTSSGAPDPGFGAGGVVITEAAVPTGANDVAMALARLDDGKLLAAARQLSIRTPPTGAKGDRIVYVAKGLEAAAPRTLFEDPRCAPDGSGAGGALTVSGSGGTFAIPLPCNGWKANSAKTRYSYRDRTGASCATVLMSDGKIEKASYKGAQVSYALGAPQAAVSVVLSTGAAGAERTSCAWFTPTSATVIADGSDGRAYRARDAAAPAACP